ncbi:hypothetical protein Hdeb2414_s0001g00000461 [Helianthus debilis subsp. tardiflorus]
MYGIYKKKYINTLHLGYEKPVAFALYASRLNFRPVAFVHLSLINTKVQIGIVTCLFI